MGKKLFTVILFVTLVLSSTSITSGYVPSEDQTLQNGLLDYYTYLPVVHKPDPWANVDPTGQEIIYWHQLSGSRETFLLNLIEGFNTTNPWDIHVTAIYKGGYTDIFNAMLEVLNTPDAPDLVSAYQNHAATYQLQNALFDMNPVVTSPTWGLTDADLLDFFPGFLASDIFPYYDSQRLGFPPGRSLEVMYYNSDWLNELGYSAPPATPVEFHSAACAAAANPFSGQTGIGNPLGYQLSLDASRFASWTFAFGGEVYDSETNQYTLNSQEAINAMTFLKGVFDEGCATLVTESYGDQTAFGAGRLLFTVGSSSGIPYYDSVVGGNFDWSVGALPHTSPDPMMNVYGASISIPKHTPERELAAWLFLKYFTTTDVQADWAKFSSYFPVRQSSADQMADFFVQNPQYANAFTLLPHTKSEPNAPNYDYARSYIVMAMAEIFANNADIVTTLNQLNIDANGTLP
jgi:multiple sugar transport system substrate-binding protein/sn-glycerol 3-phosphate transport system substrate-binding protein